MAKIVKAQHPERGRGRRGRRRPLDAASRGHLGLPEDRGEGAAYNLDALCVFLEINTWHYRCVKAKAISTAGLGFDFVVPEGVEAPKPENKQILKEFFNHPNDEITWGEILQNVLTDFEALGNGYFEVLRNRFGADRPTAIYRKSFPTLYEPRRGGVPNEV